MEKRDQIRLEKIIEYCEVIAKEISELGDEPEKFFGNPVYQKVIAFDIFQIGELVASLTDDFKKNNPEIPWRKIKAQRNIIVHHYGAVDTMAIWKTVHVDVPQLKDYCIKTVQMEKLEL